MRLRHAARRGAREGYTLLETILAVGLLSLFVGSTVMLGGSVLDAFRSETTSAVQDDRLHQALDRMTQRLRTADGDAVLPAAVAWTSWLEFQRARDHDGTNVLWGDLERLAFEYEEGELDDGVDNDGDGLVDEGRAVWILDLNGPNERRVVLASSVAENGAGEVPGNGLDDDGDGLEDEGGLAFQISGERLRVELTLVYLDEDGREREASAERVIMMRNTGVNTP